MLHILRDRLPVDESAQLAAQLPELVRGVYYEGWRPSATPQTYHDARSFLDRVAAGARHHGETEASFASEAVARLLRRRVSAGEIADVLAVPPAEVRAVRRLGGLASRGLDAACRQLLPACQRRAERSRCASSDWDAATGC